MVTPETRTKLKSAGILLTVIVFLSATSVYTFGLLANQNEMNTSGVVAELTLGVYSDSACTENCTSIDWGVCYPGESQTGIVYLKNLGTVDATLSISAIDWNPLLASSYLTLTSDYAGQPIEPDEVLPIEFTLTISSTIAGIDSFSFTISIVSEG